ncbi:MAG: bifunctional alpha,alpha-trehalose-phosphate synthase (UDP-forming)/trehalose-phosphatase [Phycisphaerales bacterium]
MRLLVVSNRLPIVAVEEEGVMKFQESAGGLVSGISAYLDSLKGSSFAETEHLWIGWPGVTIEDAAKQSATAAALSKFDAHPVFLAERSMDKFYHGFCNKIIWPLFHYFPSYADFDESFYAHYKCVNQIFCEAVAEIMQPGDVVWIHDYHLMLLPKLLRDKHPSAEIGFFLHIPFPSFELFRLLPMTWRSEILDGLLGADLIGFHTHDYAQYFLRCVLRILGHEHSLGKILLPNRLVKVSTFPMGIDFQKFHTAAANPAPRMEKSDPLESLKPFKIVLSIDRLDYAKGILNRLEGYGLFLENNPQWREKVVLVLVVVPSRIGVEYYQQTKRQIDELVGKINGGYSTVGWTPVLYQYKFLPFEALSPLYAASHVALITPLRDGMNLIAKEYVASRPDKTGVLILSEMAGASKDLAEALIINPNSVGEIAAALRTALEMPEPEQIRRNEIMQRRLQQYDVVRWADDFLTRLSTVKAEGNRLRSRLLGPPAREQLFGDYSRAHRRMLFLDYDGTLVPFARDPQAARPTSELMAVLRTLAEDARNEITLISGRDKNTLSDWFAGLHLVLVAEHGVWIRRPDQQWQLSKPLDNAWKSTIMPVLRTYADRLPGAFVEEKEYSAVWHYRAADPELGSSLAKELVDDLVSFTANINVQVLQGSKVVEVKCAGINKGDAALPLLREPEASSSKGEGTGAKGEASGAGLETSNSKLQTSSPSHFILAVGDDWTDEDLFKALPSTAYTIRVGIRHSHARFNTHNQMEVMDLLKELARQ